MARFHMLQYGIPERQENEDAVQNPSNRYQAELARLLGLTEVHFQGHHVPASHDYYLEYVDRAEGREPSVLGRPYWD